MFVKAIIEKWFFYVMLVTTIILLLSSPVAVIYYFLQKIFKIKVFVISLRSLLLLLIISLILLMVIPNFDPKYDARYQYEVGMKDLKSGDYSAACTHFRVSVYMDRWKECRQKIRPLVKSMNGCRISGLND